MARRRRRRFRWRLKPAGYAFFGILILLVGLGVFFLVRAITGGGKKAELAAMPSPTSSIELTTPSPTPVVTPEPTPAATPALDMTGAATTSDPSAASAGGAATVVKATPAPAKASATPKSSIRKATSAEKKSAKAGYVTGDGVNLRVGPSTDYMSLGKYEKNSTLVVYATDGSFQFVKMDKDGKVGFISKSFVKVGETAAPAAVVADVPTDAIGGTVTAGTVALRDGPSKENTAITELHAGDQVFVYYKTGDFYYLEAAASGKKGFAYANYVSATDTVPTR